MYSVKLGTENRTKVIAAIVLGALGLFMAGRALWPSAAPAPIATQQVVTGLPPRPPARKTGSRYIKAAEPRLDPTLDLDLLRQSEQIKYAGTGRNIFAIGMPEPIHDGTTDHGKKVEEVKLPPAPPAPPPINLKFFGFASKPGEPKKIFLSQGEDVFVASEGDIVNRRYRIVHIAPASVDVEDVLNNNRQSIPLTQG